MARRKNGFVDRWAGPSEYQRRKQKRALSNFFGCGFFLLAGIGAIATQISSCVPRVSGATTAQSLGSLDVVVPTVLVVVIFGVILAARKKTNSDTTDVRETLQVATTPTAVEPLEAAPVEPPPPAHPATPPPPWREARFLAVRAPWDRDAFMLVIDRPPEDGWKAEDFDTEIVGEEDAQDHLEMLATTGAIEKAFPVLLTPTKNDDIQVVAEAIQIGRLRQKDTRKKVVEWMRLHDAALLCHARLYRRKNQSLQVRLSMLPLEEVESGVGHGVYAFALDLRTQKLAWTGRLSKLYEGRHGFDFTDADARIKKLREDLESGTLTGPFTV